MSSRLDPITLEVIRNALPAVANEMAADMQRTSYNMMIYEIRDFCTALLGPDGKLFSQNVGGVSHFIADLGVIIEDGVEQHGLDGFKPGDVIITNHQRVAGQHLNNIVIYTPYFFEGELVCFPMVRAHWIDVGGISTGYGAGPRVTDPWQEGLQLDQLKIYEAGELNSVLHKVISDNIRFPDASLGDMRSQIAACKLAMRRLDELYGKYGVETMSTAIEQIFKETEIKCRNWVEKVPDGVYEASSFLDHDGLGGDDTVPVHARITVAGRDMSIDLSGCSDERKSAINSRTYAAARVAYKALTAPMEPVNEGSFGGLEVIIPEGNMMMARYPAPMASWSQAIPCVVDTILAALSPAIPDQIPAAHQGVMGGGLAFFGTDPDTGKPFVLQSSEGGGWGVRPFEDGESETKTVCQGDVRNGTMEGVEIKNPVIFEERAIRPDSAGAGKYRGGFGSIIKVRNLAEGRWNLAGTVRTKCPPWGLWGGKPGQTFGKYLKLPGENDFKRVEVSRHLVPPDSEALVLTSGGGGWGDPLDRDPVMVRWDVIEELVTVENARNDYGVVLVGSDHELDEQATKALREAMRAERGEPDAPTIDIITTAATAAE
jgi:N-methylhydantoinase B